MSILDSKVAASLVLCMAVSSSWGADPRLARVSGIITAKS